MKRLLLDLLLGLSALATFAQRVEFNVDSYRNMDFVTDGAVAHVYGRVENLNPMLKDPAIKIVTRNELYDKNYLNLAEVDSAGNFAVDVPVDYPHFAEMQFSDLYEEIFLMPGDTLGISIIGDGVVKFESSFADGADITSLWRSMNNDLGFPFASFWDYEKAKSGGRDGVLCLVGKVKNKVHETIQKVAPTLDKSDVSQYAKDVVLTRILTGAVVPIEELINQYSPGPEEDRITWKEYYAGLDDILPLLFDNPLILCAGNPIFNNRIQFNGLFSPVGEIACGASAILKSGDGYIQDPRTAFADGESRYDRLVEINAYRMDKTGVGNSFVAQMIMTKYLCKSMMAFAEPDVNMLNLFRGLMSDVFRLITHRKMIDILIDNYGTLVGKVAKSNISSLPEALPLVEDKSEVLAGVVKPYIGNVVYVDVWGSGCGPCRAAMLEQRELIKHYAGQPLKVVYIAEESDKEACERWMQKNDIKGEHVYLPETQFERLEADFNIVGIPYSILIDKNGDIVATRFFDFTVGNQELEQLLSQ